MTHGISKPESAGLKSRLDLQCAEETQMLPNSNKFYIPDTALTGCVREFTETFNARGITVVLAGGAARDLWHFNPPRDLDLWVLGDVSPEEVSDVLYSIPSIGDVGLYLNSGDSQVDRGDLDAVFKVKRFGFNVDVILHKQKPVSLRSLVGTFDMSINNAWLDVSEVYNVVCTAPGYPSISDGQPVVLNYAKSCTWGRVQYIKSKHPGYWFKIQEDECAAA